MKSAYELAMERFASDAGPTLSSAQKAELAEIDKKYKAKEAEARLAAKTRLRAAGSTELQEQIRQELVVELASITQRCERDKNAVREAVQ
jgi:hypothetical protein